MSHAQYTWSSFHFFCESPSSINNRETMKNIREGIISPAARRNAVSQIWYISKFWIMEENILHFSTFKVFFPLWLSCAVTDKARLWLDHVHPLAPKTPSWKGWLGDWRPPKLMTSFLSIPQRGAKQYISIYYVTAHTNSRRREEVHCSVRRPPSCLSLCRWGDVAVK